MDFLNFNNTYTNSKVQYIDQEQLKILAGNIRSYIVDLNKIKSNADALWEQCSNNLDASALEGINVVKSENQVKFNTSIEELNNFADRLDSVANIWDDTEKEIKSSSIKLGSIFDDISKTFRSAVEYSKTINKK